MAKIHHSTPEWYQRFCWVVCSGLILLGLFLLAISQRTSQFTCQRASGQCTITHPGILPVPKITFGLGFLGRVLVEETDRCCSSDNPVWYNLTIEAGGLKKSYRLLYAWVNYRKVSSVLYPAVDQVKQFMNDPTIPDVTIRLPDNRREDFYCGIYFLVVGLVYTLIKRRVIFSRRPATHQERQTEASAGETAPRKKLIRCPVCAWLWWSFVPWISAILFVLTLDILSKLLIGFSNSLYEALFYGLEGTIIIIVLVSLAYVFPQSLLIRRLGMSGLGWATHRDLSSANAEITCGPCQLVGPLQCDRQRSGDSDYAVFDGPLSTGSVSGGGH